MDIIKKKIAALIPARSGSKSIKNKNIIKLGNHPLIAYSIQAALLCKEIRDVYVTTDSKKIADIANNYGAKTPFLRPENISQDTSLDIDFFKHFINFLKSKNRNIPELIVHLSPTVPFREKNIISKAIKYLLAHPKATSLRSVSKINLTPYKIFKEDKYYLKGFFKNIKSEYYNFPRQNFPDTFLPNGHVDIIKTKFIRPYNLHGGKILSFKTKNVIDIDTKEDLNKATNNLHNINFNYLIKDLG